MSKKKMDTEKMAVKIRARALAKAEKVIEDGARLEGDFAEFFAKCPDVEKVVWTQYTPYFNDGDACVFSVGEIENYEQGEGWAALFGSYRWNPAKNRTEHTPGKYDPNLIPNPSSYDEDLMFELFGDHVRVTAHRDGTFSVEEYDHD